MAKKKVVSRQPRISDAKYSQYARSIIQWVKSANLIAPDYQADSRARDAWLREFSQREPLLGGVMSSCVQIDKNRGWTMTGGRNTVARVTPILREAEGGSGWRNYISQQSLSFYRSDLGAISEVCADGDGGPLAALYTVDPVRCKLTGMPEYPLEYYPPRGNSQKWKSDWYFLSTPQPSDDETLFGLGWCAVSRCLDLATIMVAVLEHDREMLLAKMPRGLLLLKNITEHQWEQAMDSQAEQLTAKEREFYSGLSIFFGDPESAAELTALSQLPQDFDTRTFVDILMYGYALVFGYDPSEFWPVQYGALGRGTEAEVQALKATGKGGLDFILAYQDNLQRVLPATVHFEFEQRNEQGEMLQASVETAWAEAIQAMAAPSGPGMSETLTVPEKRQLLAQRGLIPDDWTAEEEEAVSTDTGEEEERALALPEVRRVLALFPDEPIVHYQWPMGTMRTIYDPSKPRTFYSIPAVEREETTTHAPIEVALACPLCGQVGGFQYEGHGDWVLCRNCGKAWHPEGQR